MTTKQPTTFKPRFPLGQVVATPGAIDALNAAGLHASTFLDRHITGDWSELPKEDRQSNEDALKYGSRIFSSYKLPDGSKLWIITEAGRSVTTLLLPNEY